MTDKYIDKWNRLRNRHTLGNENGRRLSEKHSLTDNDTQTEKLKYTDTHSFSLSLPNKQRDKQTDIHSLRQATKRHIYKINDRTHW